jgi:hypothetical protein
VDDKNKPLKANVITLMTGTVIAQIITVAISPILTCLFSPSAFNILSVNRQAVPYTLMRIKSQIVASSLSYI